MHNWPNIANLIDEERHAYGDKHEKELWDLFKPHINENIDLHKGWFSGKSEENQDWPFQIGYYMGFKIVEHYYEHAKDKKQAVKDILYCFKIDDFQKFIDFYSNKWK